MIELFKFIYQKLDTLSGKKVYQEKVPEDEAPDFPYLVFNFSIPDRNVEQALGFLEIDFWSSNDDLETLENLVSAVDGNSSRDNPTGLDELRFFGNGFQAVFYRIFRGNIPDPDPKIRRRQLRYLVKVRFI